MSLRNLFTKSLVAVASVLSMASLAHAEAPSLIPVQGYLSDSKGMPVDAKVAVRFRLYDRSDASSATVLYEETANVTVQKGYFTAYLGDDSNNALPLELFADHDVVFLGVKLASDANEMTPLLQLATAPYAAFAHACGDAKTLNGESPAALRDYSKLTGVPSSFASTWDTVANKPSVFPSSWDVLANKPSSFPGSWDTLANKPSTFPPSPHMHAWSDLTGVPAGLNDGDNDTLGGLSCASGQVAKWNGSAWSCASDSTLTEAQVDAYVANNGYYSAGGGTISGAVTVSSTLSVSSSATAASYNFNAARTGYVTVPGVMFDDEDEGTYLVQHTTTGTLYFGSSTPAGTVAYPVAQVNLPGGVTITSATCEFKRSTTNEAMSIEFWRSNGDGTATRMALGSLSSGSGATGNDVPITLSFTETVNLPAESFYFVAIITDSAAGDSGGRMRLNDCYVQYTQAQL